MSGVERNIIAPTNNQLWASSKSRFRKNKLAMWSLRFLFVLAFIGVFADFIANEKPIYCKIEGQHHFPVFKQYAVDLGLSQWPAQFFSQDWNNYPYEKKWMPLIPYSSKSIDRNNAGMISPFDEQNIASAKYRHWLGTDEIGRDVLAGMIKGTRTALLVGLVSMSIAAFIGLILGAVAGYFGDDKFKITRGKLLLNILFFPLALFYGFIARWYTISESGNLFFQMLLGLVIFFVIMLLGNLLSAGFRQIKYFNQSISLPLDLIIMRLIEVMNSIPALLLILASVAIIKTPSVIYIMVIIGLIRWTSIARYIKGELLKVRQLPYIESTQAMGFGESRILLKHAIPNALTPVLITIAFGIASAILIEASLSFLGIGVPVEEVTWGSTLSKARINFSAWWMAVFPGLAIFFTVTIFNLIGEGLTDALDPKS